jgi:membrane-bound serine protease (ClpP class)
MFRKATWWRVLGWLLLLVAPCAAQAHSVGQILTSQPVETLLLVSGGVFLILSVLTMGSLVAEALCFASFALLFVGRYLQGEDPWVPLGLLVVGVLCLLGEVFVLPGFGICGIMGLASVGAMTVLVAGSTSTGLSIFFLTTIVSVAAGFLAIRLLPSNRFTSKLFILQPPEPGSAPTPIPPSYVPAQGDRGVAATSLRPGGYATFGDERVDVTAENEFVPKGQPLEVIRVEGFKVVVRSVRPPAHPES